MERTQNVIVPFTMFTVITVVTLRIQRCTDYYKTLSVLVTKFHLTSLNIKIFIYAILVVLVFSKMVKISDTIMITGYRIYRAVTKICFII